MDEKNLFMNGQFVSRYDDLIQDQNWYGPEILFGMIFEYINSGEKILDVGIGTGLSATAFHTSGLEVFGLDFSFEMLKVCERKEIAVDLKQFDINESPLPYPDHFFDHISANAVIYFISNLEDLFKEISRIIKKKGIWAFIVESQNDLSRGPIVEKSPGKNGLITFRHSRQYILDILEANKFTLLKELEFISKNFQMEGKPLPFTLYVTEA
ncbi:class I SAM-dependent DNA methyltransferase [Desulfospira joergensenii]|uniref:class I SAM-dependent DNA methyltransferase n=1 Tax=Desulfospira joergensenii TaxID=53329 RepID=UPI0003B368E7|nr:class I SAM-dependent methyltransferase [Desulfospira joergensenii]